MLPCIPLVRGTKMKFITNADWFILFKNEGLHGCRDPSTANTDKRNILIYYPPPLIKKLFPNVRLSFGSWSIWKVIQEGLRVEPAEVVSIWPACLLGEVGEGYMLEGLYPLDGLLSPLKSWRRWLGMGGVGVFAYTALLWPGWIRFNKICPVGTLKFVFCRYHFNRH